MSGLGKAPREIQLTHRVIISSPRQSDSQLNFKIRGPPPHDISFCLFYVHDKKKCREKPRINRDQRGRQLSSPWRRRWCALRVCGRNPRSTPISTFVSLFSLLDPGADSLANGPSPRVFRFRSLALHSWCGFLSLSAGAESGYFLSVPFVVVLIWFVNPFALSLLLALFFALLSGFSGKLLMRSGSLCVSSA